MEKVRRKEEVNKKKSQFLMPYKQSDSQKH